MPFRIVRQDITKLKVDAIVNAANTDLKMGEAVITSGFGLPAQYVIHAVGPIYREWNETQNEQLLRSAYLNSLKMAVENNLESVAFPLISSGIYGYPKEEALRVATSAIKEFLVKYDLDVTLVIFDKSTFKVSQELLSEVESYIDENYVEAHEFTRELGHFEDILESVVSLDDLVGNLDESFSERLLRLIDAKGMSDVEVYKRANLDRKLFSKIRSNDNYLPSKRTAIALAIGLKLTLEETDDFLERAGYALSHAIKFDVIVEYFIINGNYDIFAMNEVLFSYDQPLL